MKCRHCGQALTLPFVDLGSAPPSNAYLTLDQLKEPETWYPLRVLVCTRCWLVQTEDYAGRDELFDENYAYFSSYSTTWLDHARDYVATIIPRLDLGKNSLVVEIAANDGYLLQYIKERGIPCFGIEPTASTAAAAKGKDIKVIEEFFGSDLALQLSSHGNRADLIVANNVLAHVPDINDFVNGVALLLNTNGVATFEFPHLMRLIENNQFDTIYHEHYCYLSLATVEKIFLANGLVVFDVEELATHGGSLRIYAQRLNAGARQESPRLVKLREKESSAGISSMTFYQDFQSKADLIKDNLLLFLLEARRKRHKVAAYGAAAKGNTLLNYAGVRPDLLAYVVDKNPAKQGKYLPGSRIPIVPEEQLRDDKPDIVLILSWNIKEEVTAQLEYIRGWGGKFSIAVPYLQDW